MTIDLRAAASTNPKDLAGVIAAQLRDAKISYVQGVGAEAVNVIVKAIAITRGYVASSGSNVVCWPGFETVDSPEYGKTTAIRFTVVLA